MLCSCLRKVCGLATARNESLAMIAPTDSSARDRRTGARSELGPGSPVSSRAHGREIIGKLPILVNGCRTPGVEKRVYTVSDAATWPAILIRPLGHIWQPGNCLMTKQFCNRRQACHTQACKMSRPRLVSNSLPRDVSTRPILTGCRHQPAADPRRRVTTPCGFRSDPNRERRSVRRPRSHA